MNDISLWYSSSSSFCCAGEMASKKKEDNVSRTQLVALSTPRPCCLQGETGHSNALVLTAQFQGSPVFFIPYSPSAALGASARLLASGGFFSLGRRKLNLWKRPKGSWMPFRAMLGVCHFIREDGQKSCALRGYENLAHNSLESSSSVDQVLGWVFVFHVCFFFFACCTVVFFGVIQ